MLFALLGFSSAAAAQDYYILTTVRVDLQEAPGVSSVTEYAPKGIILRVAGEQGDFLNVERHGAELWLDSRGGYRPFRRIETTPGLQDLSQAPAVDSCCYLGWHCQTDDDWTRRCHTIHFGRGCYTSAQTPVSTPPETSTATVDASSANAARVTFPTSLRSHHSLQSGILTTVAAGATLSVTGSHANWLKIDWGGSEAWLAGWAPLTCVEGEPLNIPEGIDYCCFVNRDYSTDEDWERGYAAYHCTRCGLSPNQAQYHGIKIEGTESFVYMVARALNLLQEWPPEWHGYVTVALYKVMQAPAYTSSGIFIDFKTFVQGSNLQTPRDVYDDLVVDMVGGLAREAGHVHQWWDGKATTGWRNEIGCVQAQLAAIDAICWHGNWLKHLIANIEDPANWWRED